MGLAPAGDVTAVLRALVAAGATLGTAESLTGGQLAAAITAVPGASQTYLGGVVAYATQVKVDVLGVPAELVTEHGVVSPECAAAMASGVRGLLDVTYGVATTGVAGPDRQDGKPLGTVFVAVAGPEGVESADLKLQGSRSDIQTAAVQEALGLLWGTLRKEEPDVR